MKFFFNFKNIILDTLFPINCLFCSQEEEWVCQECFEKIILLPSQVCPYCEKNITEFGKICLECKNYHLAKNKKIPLNSLVVASSYAQENVSRLVHYYKYKFIEDLHVPLGKILLKSAIENNLLIPDLIAPVPLHKRRLRWRGFNQSALLANYVSQNLTPGFPIPVFSDLIIRKKYTAPQMKIKNYQERQKNIKNIFAINPNFLLPLAGEGTRRADESIKDKKILLIDDIATTGSTLFECAKVLKSNGASKVYACVVARQEWKNML